MSTEQQKEKIEENSAQEIILIGGEPPFYETRHVAYIAGLADTLDGTYEGAVTDHLRMSGIYWSLTALSILRDATQVNELLGLTKSVSSKRPALVDWVMQCWDDENGGFGGNIGHDAHLLYTLSAIQILALADRLELVNVERVTSFIKLLQQPDGSFAGDKWGEIDTRFSYCALSTLSILKRLDAIDVNQAAQYILKCRNLDGGFGTTIGAESHAGQVFCCIGALSIAKSLHLLGKDSIDLLSWWLAERQCDSGGLNGRPEKQADVCYSWWILSALSILGRVPFISQTKLATFILKCQDDVDGGIADRPDDMADVFHTFFGIAGLSLLGHLHDGSSSSDDRRSYRQIDPVYALPTDVVKRLNLQAQVVAHKDEPIDERLAHYDVVSSQDL